MEMTTLHPIFMIGRRNGAAGAELTDDSPDISGTSEAT